MGTENKINELPISLEELRKQKDAMRNLNTEIGTTIEMGPQVWEILGNGNYNPDAILATKIEILGKNLFKIEFIFPEYTGGKLEHVSSSQMMTAINQGGFLAYGMAVKNDGISSPMSYETFLLNRDFAILSSVKLKFRKELTPGEKAYLIYKIHPFKKVEGDYFIQADLVRDVSTFINGDIMCVMKEKYLFEEEQKKYKENQDTENILPDTMVGDLRTRFEANQSLQETIAMTDIPESKDLGSIEENQEEQK